MTSLQISLAILLISVLIAFFYGLLTRNYSTVDRLWSVLPAVYALVWMRDFLDNPRYIIAALLVVAWAVRLSINFARRGGYNFNWKKGFTGEDYRWEIMRKKIPSPFLFELFNLAFISIFQLVLIFAFTFPLYTLGQFNAPLSWVDFLLFALHALFLLLETIADNQQFRFYQERNSQEFKKSPRHQLGFNTFGLWKYSRHPNYACEMAQWVIVGLYAYRFTGEASSFLGSAVLILLFVGSTTLAENITMGKYSRYNEWRKVSVPYYIPLVKRKKRNDFLDSYK
ncbi:MAG: DUF1295 domain-containing protein [Candidatus Neomarinimicrobiota bacterium]